MKLLKYIPILGIVCLSSVHAGLKGLTHHSRANCVNNESISWDATEYHWLWVSSRHINQVYPYEDHTAVTGWVYTWRAAAVDWGESVTNPGDWVVHGEHWMLNSKGRAKRIAWETVKNCSIYDGWWG